MSDKKNALVEFTNPQDRGIKFLKREDNLWMFFPDAEEIIKISGHMLNQGMMGSDFSYQDIMESDNLTDLYNFEIVGKAQSPLPMINDSIFYLPLDQAQRILEMPDEVTELLIITPDYNKTSLILPALNELFAQEDKTGKYSLQVWNKGYELIELYEIGLKMYNFIYIFIIILASFVLINTLIMIVNERTREIGMMTALGLKSREILYLFTIEGAIIGILGSSVGAVLGGILTKIFSIVGIDYSAAMEGMSADLMLEPIYYTVFSLENLVFCFILGVIVVTIACIIPARMAASLEPSEALRQI